MKFKLAEAKSHFYTDGIKTIKVKEGENPPEGFHLGRTFNVNTWNKGLTANTDPRVKANGQATAKTRKERNNYNSWNKGLTKDTDDRLKTVSSKVAKATKGRTAWNKGVPASENQKQKQSLSMKGKPAWNKGLTKETDERVKSTSNKLLGHPDFCKDWVAAKAKEYATKKKNNSFNSSKPEADLIKSLKQKYGEDNVKAPYRDSRYPFNCDAYIVSEDLFIEYNGTIEHQGHPFDPNDENDIKTLEKLQERAEKLGNNNRYKNIIRWWTEIDPKKLQTFRKNNLNFIIIYPNNLIIDK